MPKTQPHTTGEYDADREAELLRSLTAAKELLLLLEAQINAQALHIQRIEAKLARWEASAVRSAP